MCNCDRVRHIISLFRKYLFGIVFLGLGILLTLAKNLLITTIEKNNIIFTGGTIKDWNIYLVSFYLIVIGVIILFLRKAAHSAVWSTEYNRWYSYIQTIQPEIKYLICTHHNIEDQITSPNKEDLLHKLEKAGYIYRFNNNIQLTESGYQKTIEAKENIIGKNEKYLAVIVALGTFTLSTIIRSVDSDIFVFIWILSPIILLLLFLLHYSTSERRNLVYSSDNLN